MDQIAPPYDGNDLTPVGGGVFGHLSHILHLAAFQSNSHGPTGIQSYPWQWLGDYRPIVYLNVNPSQPVPGLRGIHPPVHFLGMISPPILAAALLGLVLAGRELWRARVSHGAVQGPSAMGLPMLALAWTVGTLVPFELLSVLYGRASYLYYMVIVMPGLYVAAVYVFVRLRLPQPVLIGFAALVLVAVVLMYPLTPLPASVR
jgi:hypothetical protein